MNKFKIGDRVRFIKNRYQSKGLSKGDTGTISTIMKDYYCVIIDDCSVYAADSGDRLGWSFYEDQLELIPEEETLVSLPAKFKIRIKDAQHGDIVQKWLFEQGYHWSGCRREIVSVLGDEYILNGWYDEPLTQLTYMPISDWNKEGGVEIIPTLPISITGWTCVKPEIVTIMGKTYRKEDFEKALACLEWKE